MLITQLLTFSGFFNFLFGEGAQQACNKKLALAQRPHLSHYLCDFCTTPENIWTEILLFPKAAAAVFPPPVKILLYHTWQQQRVRQRSQKGKSIHFLQNIESGLPFHPQRDTQIHSYTFCYAWASVLHFFSLPLYLFLSLSFTPSPVPRSLNYLPSLLPSQQKLHMGAFESTSLLWSSKEECVASPTLVFTFLLNISGGGYSYGGCEGRKRWSMCKIHHFIFEDMNPLKVE